MAIKVEQILEFAEDLATKSSECEWRAAASRGYYAAWHCARDIAKQRHVDKWLQDPPPGVGHHEKVIQRFAFMAARPEVRAAGYNLRGLKQERERADYELGESFRAKDAKTAVASAKDLVAQFQAISSAAAIK
jgi:hypothetical protein